ncbi:MAG: NAD(P)H-hydrate dehydratase [Bacteroidia bacterium]|jgi:NAD(P)H-hydrate epimerase
MKLLTAQQIKEWDRFTIQHEPVSSVDLMERAAQSCIEPILKIYHSLQRKNIVVFCGKGNNGGDGLAIARLLLSKHIPVAVFILDESEKSSDDFKINYARLLKEDQVKLETISSKTVFPDFHSSGILVIDALFGTGVQSPLHGIAADLVNHINALNVPVVAIDLPSGLPASADATFIGEGVAIIKAKHTITFQVPKLSFFHTEFAACVGEFTVTDIGLDASFAHQVESAFFYSNIDSIRPLLKQRPKFAHKGVFGHLLTVGGSFGKMGAIELTSRAALRTGCGLVTAYLPKAGYTIMQTALPECMVETDDELLEIRHFPDQMEPYQAAGIGPGMGTHPQTIQGLKKWLSRIQLPCILDADALNGIATFLNREETDFRFPTDCIITPHPKEFDRLAGTSKHSMERLERQIQFAKMHQVVVVLKGAHTSVALPDGHVFFNASGNVALATAGSGDVLSGIIGSLLAQGYEASDAALLGVYLHGYCGDRIVEKQKTLIASDIIEIIPVALKALYGER